VNGGVAAMHDEVSVRSAILRLKKQNPDIHINFQNAHPKVHLVNEPARIGRVYAHLFELEYTLDGRQHVKTWNYADVISRRIIILELES